MTNLVNPSGFPPARGGPSYRAPYNPYGQPGAAGAPHASAPFNSRLTALHAPTGPGHSAAPFNSKLTALRPATGPGSSAAPSNSQYAPHAAGNANYSAPVNSQVTPSLSQLSPMARQLVAHALRLHAVARAQSGASGMGGSMSPSSVSNPMMYRNGMLG